MELHRANNAEESIHFGTYIGKAVVTKQSPFSGNWHTAILAMNDDQYSNWKSGGTLIQEALPHLTADEREFLMTGITPEEWNEAFGEEE